MYKDRVTRENRSFLTQGIFVVVSYEKHEAIFSSFFDLFARVFNQRLESEKCQPESFPMDSLIEPEISKIS